jgi:RNA polymerase sigma factor (sigma-70 family)
VSMRHVKTTRRREAREAPMTEELGTSNADPERQVSRASVWRRLLLALDSSPPARRHSLLLHLAEGYTVEEVAEITGVSTNTTKDRLRTAYAELRAVFTRNASLKQDILEIIND